MNNILFRLYQSTRQLQIGSINLFSTVTSKIRENIINNTNISNDHLTPEISLHLITPKCKIYHESINEDFPFITDPFWGFYWPGGQAIARFILDNPILFKNNRILDFGSGSGASSIASMKSKALSVIANDIDSVAGEAAILNAELNIVQITTDCNDLTKSTLQNSTPIDIVLVGDMFYDTEFANILMPWLQSVRQNGKIEIYLGDPGRHALDNKYKNVLTHLIKYELPDSVCIENNGFQFVNVYKFK